MSSCIINICYYFVTVKYKISSSSSTQMNEKEQGTKRVLFYLDWIEDRVTRTPLKPGVNLCAPEGWAVPASLVTPVVLI
jgi:hypothetical protein